MHSWKLRFQKWDLVAIVAVALLAVGVFCLFLPRSDSGAACAEIYLDGRLLRTVSLAEDQTFSVTGDYNNEITVRDGKIAVTASGCPGADCVHSGWIGGAGRSIVCLPNGLEIRVVSGRDDVDFVVG